SLVLRANRDSAVDDWNQMRVSGEVEHRARPRAINAREQNIAIKRSAETFFLDDTPLERVHSRVRRRRVLKERTARRLDFAVPQFRVAFGGIEQAVEIDRLHGVEVDEREPLDPAAHER